jgi:N-acetylated-alpha-linked acidic dipeptidase
MTNDPHDPSKAPPVQAAPPEFNFSPLLNALDSLHRAAMRYEAAYTKWNGAAAPATASLAAVNMQLIMAERAMTSSDGLPRRPWFAHLLYAPGYYTGYGVKTMPGAREAIEQGEWADVDAQIARIAKALQAEAALVNSAAASLEGAK